MALHDDILFNFIVWQKLEFFVWHFKLMNINNKHLPNISNNIHLHKPFRISLLESIRWYKKSIELNVLQGDVDFLIKLWKIYIILNSPCTWAKGWTWKFVFTLCKLNPKVNLQQEALQFVLKMHCLRFYLAQTKL